ncbi:hypothetical protein [Burkholderia pseudomallei]|uniref:hypothetical protein n=1 Tax=Burkholderia pseudomallei TaxID=28450 RepID=UPI000055B5A1|nr:hypothetical protein [Burkholderia pseudomallei]AJX59817.1 hypothetical protein DP47_3394 [Burkholderia pseudomallei Pasteur 52237]EDO95537.1 hypothetical protein BURPSPAST_C1361 [Burkholderia pseudomallei Pasteur 52237]KGW44007.1 hypothetical protein Y597_5838 [Burkholderia pseudomallei MSHR1000]
MDETAKLKADIAKLRKALREARTYVDDFGRNDNGELTRAAKRTFDSISLALYETDGRRA